MEKFTEVLKRMIEAYGLEATFQSIDTILEGEEITDFTIDFLKESMLEDMSYAVD